MRTLSAWVALAAATVLLTGCVSFGSVDLDELTADPATREPSPSGHVTSPDGTISVTLPDGWYDHSEAYFARVTDSTLSAAWGTSPSYRADEATFASVSTVPAVGAGDSIAILGADFAARWRDGFEDGATESDGGFTTATGASALWTRFEGTYGDHDATIIAVVILDHGRSGRIAIEAAPGDEALGDSLLDALQTVELAPFDPTVEAGGVFVDGAYVADDSISVTVPSAWEPLPHQDEVQALALRDEAVYAGIWRVPGRSDDEAALAVVVIAPILTASETPAAFLQRAGAVGDVITTSTGSVEIVSRDELVLANGMEGARVCTRATQSDLPDGYGGCAYVLTLDEWWISASVESASLTPDATAALEDLLATVSGPQG